MLIIVLGHDEVVFGYLLIMFLVLVGPLAYVAGADSRIDEITRMRRHLR